MQLFRKTDPWWSSPPWPPPLVAGGSADAGQRGRGATTLRSTSAVTSFAMNVHDGARRSVFTLPGVARISADCQASGGAWSIHVDNEQAIGWISYWETATGTTVGGGQNLEPDQEGNLGPLAGFDEVTVTIRGGFGTSASVATVLINQFQPDTQHCWVAGHAFRG